MEKQKILFLGKWKNSFKRFEFKKNNLFFLSLTVFLIALVLFLGFYFKGLIEKEKNAIAEIKKDLTKIIWQLEEEKQINLPETERVHPETMQKLKETGIERYFLSEVELINFHYTPTIHLCLFSVGMPIYPLYLYESWSQAVYPNEPPYQIALVKYLLLPEDNFDFQPEKDCFIKEIKTEKDWQEVKEKYGFSREQFSL